LRCVESRAGTVLPRKKKSGAAAWKDPDDAPELTDAFFDRAEIRHGDKIIRRGRPPLPNPKQAVKLRLDADGCAADPQDRRRLADAHQRGFKEGE
jgi:uncharacterized protein (DUF4415 family)